MAEPRTRTAILLCCALALVTGTAAAEPGSRQQRERDAAHAWLARNDDSGQRSEGGKGREDRVEPRARDGDRGQENRAGRYYRERPERRPSDVGQPQRIERREPAAGQQPRKERPEIGIAPRQRAERGPAGQPVQSRRWEDFSLEERQRLERREQGFRALPGEQQQRLRQAEQRYRSMPPDQREELRRRWDSMSETDRERYRRRVEKRDD